MSNIGVYLQPLAVSASSAYITSDTTEESANQTNQTYTVTSPSTIISISPNAPQPRLFRKSFSSLPIITMAELVLEYHELGEALSEMTTLDDDDERWIDPPVANIARRVASELMNGGYPAPHIFNHGPKSVVFNWSRGADNLYLTVSTDSISALISSPQRIKRRIDYPLTALATPDRLFPSIQSAYWERPIIVIKSASSDAMERPLA